MLYDREARQWRCWYHGLCAVQSDQPRRDPHLPWEPGYAESADGIHWIKPPLNLAPHRGRPCNRIVNDFDGWIFNTVFPNPDPTDHARKFLSIWKTRETFHSRPMTWQLASSADGLTWKLAQRDFFAEPAARFQRQDFWQILHERDAPAEYRCKSYMQYHEPRAWDGSMARQVALQHGPDLFHLRNADPAIILAPEKGLDEEIHFASVAKLGGAHLMLFESDRFSHKPLHGDLRLAVSDDGRAFRRVHPRTPLVPTGPKGSWDENLLVNTNYSLQEVGDEVWIYYFGCPNLFRNFPGGYAVSAELRGSLYYPSYLGLATTPRDRFGYATGEGSITSRPIELRGDGLWLNAAGNELQVALVGRDSKVVAEGALTDERHQTVYRKVKWNKTLAHGPYQVRVTLKKGCQLFSIRWREKP